MKAAHSKAKTTKTTPNLAISVSVNSATQIPKISLFSYMVFLFPSKGNSGNATKKNVIIQMAKRMMRAFQLL
jgi:hypothetical protein